jgi:hypothetical protein
MKTEDKEMSSFWNIFLLQTPSHMKFNQHQAKGFQTQKTPHEGRLADRLRGGTEIQNFSRVASYV